MAMGAMVMMLTAALVTAANTKMKWPVSTSQLACFSVVGTAVAMCPPVFWGTTVIFLIASWIGSPLLSALSIGLRAYQIGRQIGSGTIGENPSTRFARRIYRFG